MSAILVFAPEVGGFRGRRRSVCPPP